MIEDIQGIENYNKGKLMDGLIKYYVGDTWTD